jgi:hypothetical protein
MDLIIHVGLHKTGTKAVQYFLDINRDELLKRNVFFPNIGMHGGQHALFPASVWPHEEQPHPFLKNISNEQLNLDYNLDLLRKDLDKHKPSLTIMSSEVWSEICFLEKDSLYLINNKIAPLFDSTKILISIRNFEDSALSSLKHRLRLSIENNLDYNRNIISMYYSNLDNTKRVFNYWLESGLSIIVKNYENNEQDLLSNYLKDIFELYSPEAKSILYNNKDEKINADNLPTIFYLISFLKNNTNDQTQNATEASQLIEKLSIKYKNSNLQNNNLLKYVKYFEDKYYNDEDLSNIRLEEKIKALDFAGIKI